MRDFAKSSGNARNVDRTEEVEAAISVRYFFAKRLTFPLDWKANMDALRVSDWLGDPMALCWGWGSSAALLPSLPSDNGIL